MLGNTTYPQDVGCFWKSMLNLSTTEDPTAALQMAGSFPTPATVAWCWSFFVVCVVFFKVSFHRIPAQVFPG